MSDKITIPAEIANEFNNGMKFGSGVQLPFSVIYLRAHNGESSMGPLKEHNPTAFFGGWVTDRDPVDALAESGIDIPDGFKGPIEMDDNGKSYEVYTSRSILIAPIGYRSSWFWKAKGLRRPEKAGWAQNFRHHMQLVAYMGARSTINGQTVYNPWHPVVLTAYGHQVDRLKRAINEWNTYTSKIRSAVAPGVPAWFFYLAVGTFGKDRVQEMVGKGEQSPITPIRAFLPDPLKEDLIRNLFVGEDMVKTMMDLREQAQDYLHAWDAPIDEKKATGTDENGEPWVEEDEGEDIPF